MDDEYGRRVAAWEARWQNDRSFWTLVLHLEFGLLVLCLWVALHHYGLWMGYVFGAYVTLRWVRGIWCWTM